MRLFDLAARPAELVSGDLYTGSLTLGKIKATQPIESVSKTHFIHYVRIAWQWVKAQHRMEVID